MKIGTEKYVKILGRNHSKFMVDNIWESYDKECYSNVKFICKQNTDGSLGKTLFANKAVLAAGSKKFYLMLSDTGDEDVNIIVPENDFHAVEMLLQYIYTGEVIVGHLRNELESFISDWEIGYPEINPLDWSTIRSEIENRTVQSDSNTSKLIQLKTPKKTTEHTKKMNNVAKETGNTLFFSSDLFEEIILPDLEHTFDHDYATRKKDTNSTEYIHPKETSTKSIRVISESEDAEEDKADFLLSQAFLKEEKTRNLKLLTTSKELKEIVDRHELYIKHFIDPLFSTPKPKVVKKVDKDVRIPCTMCGKEIHRDYMNEHIRTVHCDERSFLCEQCGATFPLENRLKKHVKRWHSDNKETHTCKVCNKEFGSGINLRRHMSVHTGEKPHQCPYCEKTFRLQCVLKKHKRTHTGEKPYLCSICGKQFATHSTYAEHLKTHKEKRTRLKISAPEFDEVLDPSTQLLKCRECGQLFQREYAFLIHEATHKKEVPILPCRRCPGTFPSLKILREHVKNHHADTIFSCDQCANFYNTKTALETHKQNHMDLSAAFPCTECEKSFLTKIKLGFHMKNVHSTERPFKCRFCPKDFKVRKLLCEHERLHTGERPYQCPHCPKCFRVQVHLNNHVRTHTGEKPFVCRLCAKGFAARNNLLMHMKIHTGQKIRCDTCRQVFRSTVKLKQHQCVCVEGAEEEVYEEEVRDEYEEVRDEYEEQTGDNYEEEPRAGDYSYDSHEDD